MTDPISGTWTTGGNFIYLRFDGQRALTGVVTAGHRDNLATIKTGTFDPATSEMTIAGEARNPRDGATVSYEIRGRLTEGRLVVDYRFGDDRGNGTLVKVRALDVLRSAVFSIVAFVHRWIRRRPPPIVGQLNREQLTALRRTKAQNEQAMRERGETLESLTIREPREDDIRALAQLHVVTWAATYPDVTEPPTFAIRHWQWREAFAKQDGSWFCYVVENAKGELVGFAKGVRLKNNAGDLNKIYLLWDYHRLGLGRRMLGHVTRRFISMGVTTMYVSAEADNPSCRFYEATGAVNTVDERTGRLNGGSYVWRDLAALSAQCPD